MTYSNRKFLSIHRVPNLIRKQVLSTPHINYPNRRVIIDFLLVNGFPNFLLSVVKVVSQPKGNYQENNNVS